MKVKVVVVRMITGELPTKGDTQGDDMSSMHPTMKVQGIEVRKTTMAGNKDIEVQMSALATLMVRKHLGQPSKQNLNCVPGKITGQGRG